MKPEYDKHFITQRLAITNELLSLDWLTKREARHEYFMSVDKRSYSYGNDIDYDSNEFSMMVGLIMGMLNVDSGTEYNACFLNKYDNEQQHLGWHSDDFEGMDQNHPIAVISFGAEREIWVKEKGAKGVIPPEDRYLLEQGSLFVMPEGFQDKYLHKIPKCDRVCDWRISLTFRKFL